MPYFGELYYNDVKREGSVEPVEAYKEMVSTFNQRYAQTKDTKDKLDMMYDNLEVDPLNKPVLDASKDRINGILKQVTDTGMYDLGADAVSSAIKDYSKDKMLHYAVSDWEAYNKNKSEIMSSKEPDDYKAWQNRELEMNRKPLTKDDKTGMINNRFSPIAPREHIDVPKRILDVMEKLKGFYTESPSGLIRFSDSLGKGKGIDPNLTQFLGQYTTKQWKLSSLTDAIEQYVYKQPEVQDQLRFETLNKLYDVEYKRSEENGIPKYNPKSTVDNFGSTEVGITAKDFVTINPNKYNMLGDEYITTYDAKGKPEYTNSGVNIKGLDAKSKEAKYYDELASQYKVDIQNYAIPFAIKQTSMKVVEDRVREKELEFNEGLNQIKQVNKMDLNSKDYKYSNVPTSKFIPDKFEKAAGVTSVIKVMAQSSNAEAANQKLINNLSDKNSDIYKSVFNTTLEGTPTEKESKLKSIISIISSIQNGDDNPINNNTLPNGTKLSKKEADWFGEQVMTHQNNLFIKKEADDLLTRASQEAGMTDKLGYGSSKSDKDAVSKVIERMAKDYNPTYTVNNFVSGTPEQKAILKGFDADLTKSLEITSKNGRQEFRDRIWDNEGNEVHPGTLVTVLDKTKANKDKPGGYETKQVPMMDVVNTVHNSGSIGWSLRTMNDGTIHNGLAITLEDLYSVNTNPRTVDKNPNVSGSTASIAQDLVRDNAKYRTFYIEGGSAYDRNIVKMTKGFAPATVGIMRQIAMVSAPENGLGEVSVPSATSDTKNIIIRNPQTLSEKGSKESPGATWVLEYDFTDKNGVTTHKTDRFYVNGNENNNYQGLINTLHVLEKGEPMKASNDGYVTKSWNKDVEIEEK
jgi:hypothetical protein